MAFDINFFERVTPKTFFRRYSLKKGSHVIGIVMCCVSAICALIVGIEMAFYKECEKCTNLVLHNAYSFSINALIYCILLVIINIWFIWGVKREKSSVVLCWLVVSCMWWIQSLTLIIILICIYISTISLVWIVMLIFVLLAFALFGYFMTVVCGYWLEIKNNKTDNDTNTGDSSLLPNISNTQPGKKIKEIIHSVKKDNPKDVQNESIKEEQTESVKENKINGLEDKTKDSPKEEKNAKEKE